MKVLGDIHGRLHELARVMRSVEGEVLCVGDVGIGFSGVGQNPSLSKRFWFIRGNHDWPYWCKKHPQFAADYGMWRGIFVIGGARSVDQADRVEGKSWWRDEELSHRECEEALALYEQAKPRVVVSHDCPFSVQPELKRHVVKENPFLEVYGEPRPYPQTVMMDRMLEIHRPDLWLFGHWHTKWQKQVGKTLFRCVHIFELVDIPEELLDGAT